MKGAALSLMALLCLQYGSVRSISPGFNICELPIVIGPCEAAIPSYGHVGSGRCEMFLFGGCKGNENNFETREECEQTCPPPADVCDLPVVPGPCRGSIPRWASKDGICQEFIYGGCGGNANNFKTREECEKSCPPTEDICELPVVVGPCEAAISRWASVDGVCKQFIFGGCQGNANNFETERECEATCGSQ